MLPPIQEAIFKTVWRSFDKVHICFVSSSTTPSETFMRWILSVFQVHRLLGIEKCKLPSSMSDSRSFRRKRGLPNVLWKRISARDRVSRGVRCSSCDSIELTASMLRLLRCTLDKVGPDS
mmetsp:Transcript_19558/g.40183  ORF Transcript_19558/g.40183 Transcript_19558/m.40183 type:complete len:120 (-) Transcript_19558:1138-1497(-)